MTRHRKNQHPGGPHESADPDRRHAVPDGRIDLRDQNGLDHQPSEGPLGDHPGPVGNPDRQVGSRGGLGSSFTESGQGWNPAEHHGRYGARGFGATGQGGGAGYAGLGAFDDSEDVSDLTKQADKQGPASKGGKAT